MPGKKRSAISLEEEEFPRGGGSSLAPIVHKQLKNDAYAEAEAELFSREARRKGKKKRKSTDKQVDESDGDEEDVFFGKLSAQDKLPKFAELLKFRNLSKGMRIWGTVAEVLSKELIINLPHGLKGHVAYSQASDLLIETSPSSSTLPSLADLFSPGQYVRCVVINLLGGKSNTADGNKAKDSTGGKSRKKIELSLHVSRINSGITVSALKPDMAFPASVKSVEDHGYVLSFGVKGTSGFLPKKNAPTVLRAGSLVDVVIQKVRPGGISEVTAIPSIVAAATTKEWEGINISTLLPGSLVNARVRNVLSDGLLLSFLTFFTATIDPFHLGSTGEGRQKNKGSSNAHKDDDTTNMNTSDWKDSFSANQKLKARILYVNPETKHIGLSLQRHLLDRVEHDQLPPIGHIFETALIRRVDPGLGVLLHLPDHANGFAHISNLADTKIDAIEDRFRQGQIVQCRVIGSRPMDGLATVSLKPSTIKQSMLSMDDITAGMVINGTVVRVDDTSLVIQLTPHLTALVPMLHLSDVVSPKTIRKFKEGQKVAGRVLSVDVETKKLTMTLKPSMIQSKLPIISSLEEGVAIGKSHGVVTGLQEYGIFVSFYNNISGFIPRNECGLVEGQKILESFTLGQVVKPRVTGVNTKRKGLRLSFISKKKAAELRAAAEDSFGGLEPGSIVSGVVAAVFNNTEGHLLYMDIELYNSPGPSSETASKSVAVGRMDVNHLSDHPGSIEALSDIVKVGTRFDSLLILQKLEHAKRLRVTRKASLLASAPTLPSDLTELIEGATYQGYVASIAADAIFVRFLGDLTGRAGLAHLADRFVSDPHAYFSLGQSVQAHIVDIDHAKNQFSVSLKHSLTASLNSSSEQRGLSAGQYMQSYFEDIATAHRLDVDNHTAGISASTDAINLDWPKVFPIGHAVRASTHEMKEYGLLCDVPQHDDLVGIVDISHLPQGNKKDLETPGKSVMAIVLDYNEKDGVVDLSLMPDVIARAGSKGEERDQRSKKDGKGSQSPHIGQVIEGCTVLLVKPEEGYCIVSLPECDDGSTAQWIGYLATSDYNMPPRFAASKQPSRGTTVKATVSAVLDSGRVLLAMPLTSSASKGASKKKEKNDPEKQSKSTNKPPKVGSCVTVKIDAIHALHADVTMVGSPHRGRIHITETRDDVASDVFASSSIAVGNTMEVVVLGRMQSTQGKKHGLFEFSCRPSALESAKKGVVIDILRKLSWNSIKVDDALVGYVQQVSNENIWVVFGPTLRGRIFLPGIASSLEECENAQKLFQVGTVVKTVVQCVDSVKHTLDLTLVDDTEPSVQGKTSSRKKEAPAIAHSLEDAKKNKKPMIGMVTGISGNGILVKLSPGATGRVSLADIYDVAVENALHGFRANQFVQVACVKDGKKGGVKSRESEKSHGNGVNSVVVNLTLKPSLGGACAAHAMATPVESKAASGKGGGIVPTGIVPAEIVNTSHLKRGQEISGYVKSVGATGVFVCVSRNVDARIKLRQLSHTFIENPEESFPEGTYVQGTILQIDGGKIDMTLREQKPAISLESLEEGQIVKGRVKKIETYGVFIELVDGDAGGACGLAHVSELSDEYIKDISEAFKVDQRVTARVLSIDKEAGKLSLGLKESYFEDLDSEDKDGEGGDGEENDFEDQLEAAMDDEDDGLDEEGLGDGGDGLDGGEGEEFDFDDDLMDEAH